MGAETLPLIPANPQRGMRTETITLDADVRVDEDESPTSGETNVSDLDYRARPTEDGGTARLKKLPSGDMIDLNFQARGNESVKLM
jgi:hypothetical protein